jgi:lysophospholipase L1-like esterase
LALVTSAGWGVARAADNRVSRVVYVSFGDSLTTCAGVDDPAIQCYPALLAHHLPAGGVFYNIATDGAGIDDALHVQLPQALAKHATLATIGVGAVDILNSTPMSEYKTGLDRLLSALQHAHVRTFLANISDFRYIPAVKDQRSYDPVVRAYNAAIAALGAKYGVPIVNLFAASKMLYGNPAFDYEDGVHLSVAGQRALAGVYYGVMHRHGAL